MKCNVYTDVRTFYQDVFELLQVHQVQNSLMLGNLQIGYDGLDKAEWKNPANWFMATVYHGEEIVLIALMTPPFGMTLYGINNEINRDALNRLSETLVKEKIPVSGVVAEQKMAEAFAESYHSQSGKPFKVIFRQMIYELTDVNENVPQVGVLRQAIQADLAFLPYWFEAFDKEALERQGKIESNPTIYQHYIDSGKLFILEMASVPVTMVRINREIQGQSHVGHVFTPPYWRGKGYASSAVGQLSKRLVKEGKRCVLYTDLANATANGIYQKIGYEPQVESVEIRFLEGG